MTMPNGDVFYGEFINGMKHGEFIRYDSQIRATRKEVYDSNQFEHSIDDRNDIIKKN